MKNVAVAELDEFLRWRMNVKLGGRQDVYELFRSVPWLGRGITLIAQAIHDLPFDIVDDDDEIVDDVAGVLGDRLELR